MRTRYGVGAARRPIERQSAAASAIGGSRIGLLGGVLLVLLSLFCAYPAGAQSTLRSAVVALTDDPKLRTEFEQQLVAKAIRHQYDAVPSYDIVPSIKDFGSKKIVDKLAAQGIQAVLIARPAAVGPGSSLESVRNEVDPKLYENMRAFARDVSPAGADDLIAVVHLAIYVIRNSNAELISGGAVWLDEKVDSREQAMQRLEDLIVSNVDLVRPRIREHLGLPPLSTAPQPTQPTASARQPAAAEPARSDSVR